MIPKEIWMAIDEADGALLGTALRAQDLAPLCRGKTQRAVRYVPADQPAPTKTGLGCDYWPNGPASCGRTATHRSRNGKRLFCSYHAVEGDEQLAETAPQGAPRRILGGKGGQTVGLEPHWRVCPCSECDETRFGSEDKNPGEVVK